MPVRVPNGTIVECVACNSRHVTPVFEDDGEQLTGCWWRCDDCGHEWRFQNPELNPDAAPLTSEQVAILDHTVNRAARGLFCGDSDDMQILVKHGLMRSAGRVSWCPEEYFRITDLGRVVLADKVDHTSE